MLLAWESEASKHKSTSGYPIYYTFSYHCITGVEYLNSNIFQEKIWGLAMRQTPFGKTSAGEVPMSD